MTGQGSTNGTGDGKTGRSAFRVHFRLYPDSPDERHQALVEWYQQLPRDHAGRVIGLHDHFLDLLYRGLVGSPSSPGKPAPEAPQVTETAPTGGNPAPTKKKRSKRKKEGAEKRPAEKPRLNPTAASVMDKMDGF